MVAHLNSKYPEDYRLDCVKWAVVSVSRGMFALFQSSHLHHLRSFSPAAYQDFFLAPRVARYSIVFDLQSLDAKGPGGYLHHLDRRFSHVNVWTPDETYMCGEGGDIAT